MPNVSSNSQCPHSCGRIGCSFICGDGDCFLFPSPLPELKPGHFASFEGREGSAALAATRAALRLEPQPPLGSARRCLRRSPFRFVSFLPRADVFRAFWTVEGFRFRRRLRALRLPAALGDWSAERLCVCVLFSKPPNLAELSLKDRSKKRWAEAPSRGRERVVESGAGPAAQSSGSSAFLGVPPKSSLGCASAQSPQQPQQDAIPTGCSVYVGNLAWGVRNEELTAHMSQVGEVCFFFLRPRRGHPAAPWPGSTTKRLR